MNAPSAATDPGCRSVTKTYAKAGKDEAHTGQVSGAVTTVRLVAAAAGLVGTGIWAGIGGSKKRVRVDVQGTRGRGVMVKADPTGAAPLDRSDPRSWAARAGG